MHILNYHQQKFLRQMKNWRLCSHTFKSSAIRSLSACRSTSFSGMGIGFSGMLFVSISSLMATSKSLLFGMGPLILLQRSFLSLGCPVPLGIFFSSITSKPFDEDFRTFLTPPITFAWNSKYRHPLNLQQWQGLFICIALLCKFYYTFVSLPAREPMEVFGFTSSSVTPIPL